jgi:hypothetical protein
LRELHNFVLRPEQMPKKDVASQLLCRYAWLAELFWHSFIPGDPHAKGASSAAASKDQKTFKTSLNEIHQ